MSAKATPVGGPIMTKPFKVLLFFSVLGGILIAWRFAVGLGASTGMNDGYPWGIWIAYDVVTGTALGCGGYAVAILLYIFNKGKYHPLIRSAILTSALGYTMAAVSICLDVGRPWLIWRIPLGGFPDMGSYNWNSALLEVALCVMAYLVVLWIELSPAFFEKWMESGNDGSRQFLQEGRRLHGEGAHLDRRSRPPAAHHAPVVARQLDAAGRSTTAPTLAYTLPAACSSSSPASPWATRRWSSRPVCRRVSSTDPDTPRC